MQKLKAEISEKKHQMHVLERRMIGSVEMTSNTSTSIEMPKVTLCDVIGLADLKKPGKNSELQKSTESNEQI